MELNLCKGEKHGTQGYIQRSGTWNGGFIEEELGMQGIKERNMERRIYKGEEHGMLGIKERNMECRV
jgi:hypothetical protein